MKNSEKNRKRSKQSLKSRLFLKDKNRFEGTEQLKRENRGKKYVTDSKATFTLADSAS